MPNILFKIILLSLIFECSYSQESDSLYSNENQIKHRIGIGISNFINSAFSSDKNAYNIEYRYKRNEKTSLRSGLSYESNDSESGFFDIGFKIGVDKRLKDFKSWSFYYGLDILSNYSNFKNINKNNYLIGIAPFLGIQYKVSNNFSISIEPNIYINYRIVVDNSTFMNDNVTRWTESGLGKLGYIQVNFHF